MFSTITAKFAATCKRCHGEIAVGQKMRYGGRGRTYHLKATCPASSGNDGGVDAETMALARTALSQGIVSDDEEQMAREYPTPNGVSYYTRFSSGAEVFVNKRGRCEDAPCCGCCS